MSLFSTPARIAAHHLREAALYPRIIGAPKERKVLILQSMGREMSGLLRGYEMADKLNERGWHCLVPPKQLSLGQRRRVLRWFGPDIVLLLKSRDPRNSRALLEGYPYLYDVDDADFLDPALTARMADDVAGAKGVMAGSRYVADWCRQHNPNTRVVWTGAKPMARSWTDHSNRGRLLTWAQSNPVRYPKEFDFVVTVMEQLAQRQRDLTLRLYGGDGTGDGGRSDRLRACGVTIQWMPYMDYDAFVRSLDDVAIGFSPICVQSEFSRGKSFGKIIAYLDARVPVITSNEVDHSALFTPGTAVVSNDPDIWVAEAEALLSSADKRRAMSDAAYDLYLANLSLDAAANKVEAFISEIL